MWAQYRKTFWPMQAMILLVALAVYFGMNRFLMRALVFWLMMQLGAVLGAAWATRLKNKIERNRSRLPLDKRG